MPGKHLPGELKLREILTGLPVLQSKKADIDSYANRLAWACNGKGRYDRFRDDPYLNETCGKDAIKVMSKVLTRALSLQNALKPLSTKAWVKHLVPDVSHSRAQRILKLQIEDLKDSISDLEKYWAAIKKTAAKDTTHKKPQINIRTQKTAHATFIVRAAQVTFEELTGLTASVSNPNRRSKSKKLGGKFLELLLQPVWDHYDVPNTMMAQCIDNAERVRGNTNQNSTGAP